MSTGHACNGLDEGVELCLMIAPHVTSQFWFLRLHGCTRPASFRSLPLSRENHDPQHGKTSTNISNLNQNSGPFHDRSRHQVSVRAGVSNGLFEGYLQPALLDSRPQALNPLVVSGCWMINHRKGGGRSPCLVTVSAYKCFFSPLHLTWDDNS